MDAPPLVRPMRESDVASFVELFESIIIELHGDNRAAIAAYLMQYTAERMNALLSDTAACLVVAEQDGVLVGFGAGRNRGGVGYLQWMGVLPQSRGHGVGTAIGSAMMQHFQEAGCHKLELYTYEAHPELVTLYTAWGFAAAARLKNHYYHLDVVYMIKDVA